MKAHGENRLKDDFFLMFRYASVFYGYESTWSGGNHPLADADFPLSLLIYA